MAEESWREAFPEVPTDELDAPDGSGMWSDPNFSLSKSANIGKCLEKGGRGRESRRSCHQSSRGIRRRKEKSVGSEEKKKKRGRKAKGFVREAPMRSATPSPRRLALFMPLPQSFDRVDIVAKEGGGNWSSERAVQARATWDLVWR